VKTKNRSVLRKSRFGSVFDISVRFFGNRTDGITNIYILYIVMHLIADQTTGEFRDVPEI